MDIREKFYEIMEKENSFDELIGEVTDILEDERKAGNIKGYKHEIDMDVFDSCGLDIYYLSICWIDNNDELQIAGASYYSS